MKIKGIDFNQAMQIPELKQKYDENPKKFMKEYSSNPMKNIGVFKIVIRFIGITLIICVISGVIINLWPPDEITNNEYHFREIPDLLKMVASAAIGAITGLLVSTPPQNQNNKSD
ncbi:hypothetical protein IMCC3317_40560 [Kordia antarctica]|uniref:Holin n=1 Tax=Kordia antarctica TaxID=1218801 RepID=A0A7L4ZPV6_9FLAO|nr:hypothetical protein [Kordia antarctica]QHI38662.1 hypothetical protein IMCC3317_40560 [Kordia antarctica]